MAATRNAVSPQQIKRLANEWRAPVEGLPQNHDAMTAIEETILTETIRTGTIRTIITDNNELYQ
jgi:hypothetical protein